MVLELKKGLEPLTQSYQDCVLPTIPFQQYLVERRGLEPRSHGLRGQTLPVELPFQIYIFVNSEVSWHGSKNCTCCLSYTTFSLFSNITTARVFVICDTTPLPHGSLYVPSWKLNHVSSTYIPLTKSSIFIFGNLRNKHFFINVTTIHFIACTNNLRNHMFCDNIICIIQ